MRLVAIFSIGAALAAAPLAAQGPVIPPATYATLATDAWQRYLPPPPPAGSTEEAEDLRVLLDVQARRTPAEVALAQADQKIGPERFAAIIGRPLDASLPRTVALLTTVGRATRPVSDASKAKWKRLRPYDASPQVQPVVDKPGSPGNPSWAYPSGHSMWGYATALVLAAMLPEKRDAILARGRAFGWSRVVGGVHWPSDVAAGRIAAVATVERLARDAGFRRDLDAATRELRAAMQLPPREADLP